MSNSERSFKQDAILLIVGILLGGVVTYGFTWYSSQEQRDLEQHNVAQALYIDISHTSDHFNSSLEDLNLSLSDMNKTGVYAPIMIYDPRPYYTDNGLYFVFTTEISRLDSNLSANLYDYYQTVMDIEHKRQYNAEHISKAFNGENLSEEEQTYLTMYSKTMTIEMIYSIEQGERIKKELKEKYNLNLDLPRYYTQIFHVPHYTIKY